VFFRFCCPEGELFLGGWGRPKTYFFVRHPVLELFLFRRSVVGNVKSQIAGGRSSLNDREAWLIPPPTHTDTHIQSTSQRPVFTVASLRRLCPISDRLFTELNLDEHTDMPDESEKTRLTVNDSADVSHDSIFLILTSSNVFLVCFKVRLFSY